MPEYGNVAPAVFGALYKDYSYYNERFGRVRREHMKVTPEIESLALSITGDAGSDVEKIARLYHWVQQNIRYISVKGTFASKRGGHYAQITLDNKYGDCSDKAIFFATLLKVAGIEAYPVSLRTNDAGFADMSLFPFYMSNHAINEVWWDGEPHILDATNNFYRFPYYPNNDSDIWYANYVKGEVRFNPPVPPEDNAMRSETVIEIDDSGAALVNDIIRLTGQREAGWRGYFNYVPETRHRQIAESIVNSRKAGAVLDTFEFRNVAEIAEPFSAAFAYKVEGFLVEAGAHLLLEVPALGYSFPEIALKERLYGIKLDETYQRRHDVTFKLPQSMTIEYVPEEIKVFNRYFDYTAGYERLDDGVRFIDEFNRKELRIPAEDYGIYKADAEKVLAYLKRRVFLTRK